MKVLFTRDSPTGGVTAQIQFEGKSLVPFNYPLMIKGLYSGEQIDDILFQPEDAFDRVEKDEMSKLVKDINAIVDNHVQKGSEPEVTETEPSAAGDISEEWEASFLQP